MLYDSFKIFPRQAFFYIKFLPPKHLPFAQQFLDVKRCIFFQADIIYTASSGIFVYSCFVGFAQSELTKYFYWIIIFIAITLSICKQPLIKSWNNDCCQINCNEVKMSQSFHDIARLERFTDLHLYKIFVQSHSKLGYGCVTILFSGTYFLLAVTVEGDESSLLRMAN